MISSIYTTKLLTIKSDDPTMTYHFFKLLEAYPGFNHPYFAVLEYTAKDIHALRVYECCPADKNSSMENILSGVIDFDLLLFYGTNLYSEVHDDTKSFLRMYNIYETMIQ